MTAAIRVRYVTHPGSNVGSYRATVHGMRATVRIDQSLPRDRAARAAAVRLAGKLPAPSNLPGWLESGEILTALTAVATDTGYAFDILEPWGPEETRAPGNARSTARALLTRHEHGSLVGEPAESVAMARENCGACVLTGYGADTDGPNYAGWARVYVQAGRRVPAEWRAAFVRELAGSDPVSPNYRYADALRRDLLTYGGAS